MKIYIPTKELVHEIVNQRSTDLYLMSKYNIPSAPYLYKAFNKLIRAGRIERNAISNRLPQDFTSDIFCEPTVAICRNDPVDIRSTPRNYLFAKVEIYDMASVNTRTMSVEDISEFGLRIYPIKTFQNDVREFMIRNVLLDEIKPFSFTAECCWTKGLHAGFKIIGISPQGMQELRGLISSLGFESF
jgi:hypothetical protein